MITIEEWTVTWVRGGDKNRDIVMHARTREEAAEIVRLLKAPPKRIKVATRTVTPWKEVDLG